MATQEIRSRHDLAKHFARLGFVIGAEIGVAGGRYSECLCKLIPNLKLFAVDYWDRYHGNRRGGLQAQHFRNYEIAKERLKPYNVEFIRAKSMDAVVDFEDGTLDFVYIDANHDYSYVKDDIEQWSRKVRVGGIVAGHDYYNFKNSGVIEAVDEYVKANNLELGLTSKDTDYHEVSWYFTKK
jgi:hypothetical protein